MAIYESYFDLTYLPHFWSCLSDSCLRPLVNEILEEDPDPEDEAEIKKLFRKISIYIVLASGLGNPGLIQVSVSLT